MPSRMLTFHQEIRDPIISNWFVHRMANNGEREYSDEKGHQKNGLEGFWGYLKRKLAAKGGIR